MKTSLALAAALAMATAVLADEPAPLTLPASWVGAELDSAVPDPRPVQPDASAEIQVRKSYAIPAAEIVGFDLLLNQFDRRVLGEPYHTNLASIRRNLHSSWVEDRDPFLVNQLGHPYQGSMYHGFARASGLGYWEAAAYTFAGSAFWEIAGETSTPSRNDQVNTGIGGSFLGEALFRMANLVLEHDHPSRFWREIAAAVASPPVGFNRAAYGERFRAIFPSHDPEYFSRLQLGFSGATQQNVGTSTTRFRPNEALADFYMEYGLPGKPGYEYRRPFDYFTFQATASSANGFENVMTRGLLFAKPYAEGRRYRGVWGLYGSYDYIAPQTYRVSSTALGLGTVGQWWLTDAVALQATAVGGIGYVAAGTIRSSDEADYHHGLAPQALAGMKLILGGRASFDVMAREYYVSRVAAAARGGHENIGRLDAAFTWRVKGRHGVSIKYLGNRRDASYPDIGGLVQQHQSIGIFYTLLGQDRFGAVEWR